MLELLQISNLVKSLLTKDEKCRNSDSYLYLMVLSVIAEGQGVDIKDITISDFLLYYQGKTFPVFETVRRSRAKVQELHPELRACEAVEGYRSRNEKKFRAYVRCDV